MSTLTPNRLGKWANQGHQIVPGANVIAWGRDATGHEQAVPFPCDSCGNPSCYGLLKKWYCSECWIKR